MVQPDWEQLNQWRNYPTWSFTYRHAYQSTLSAWRGMTTLVGQGLIWSLDRYSVNGQTERRGQDSVEWKNDQSNEAVAVLGGHSEWLELVAVIVLRVPL